MPREHHRRRSSPDSSRRRNRRRSREFYYNNPAAPSASRAADSVYMSHPRLDRRGSRSSLSSSSSSSYLEISRNSPPRRSGNVFTTFFTAPSEHRRRSRRRARARILPFGNSSSSSVDSDLAYGTGFVRRPRDSRRQSHQAQPQQHHRDDYRTPSQYQWENVQQPQHDTRYAPGAAPQGYPQARHSHQRSDSQYQPGHDPAYSQYHSQPPTESQGPRESRAHTGSSTATPTSFAGPAIGAGLGLAAASALGGHESRHDRAGRERDHRDGRGRRRPRDDRDDQYLSSTADSNATPRPARMQRRSTDEEIMHLGRELTRLHSDIDSRPTGLVAGGSKKGRDRGIGSSRPYDGPYSSDDEGGEWESVSSESDKEDFLAYGSTVSFPQASSRPAEPPATAGAHPPRRSTLVDPRNFGPQNSLNGFVSPLPSSHPPSAPLQQVQAMPMDDERGSIPPSTQVYPKLSRPTDVQLEQPKPVAPVSPERLERSSYAKKQDRKVSDANNRKTSSSGKVLTGAALATAAGVVGHTILSDEKAKDSKRARAEELSRRDDQRDSTKPMKRDRRAADARERERNEEEERRKKLIDAEYEEYVESMKRKSGGDRSRRTKHEVTGRPRESREEEPRKPRDQPRLPSSQQMPTGDYFDYRRVSDDSRAGTKAPIDPFQFQVADDAFPTPTYSPRATSDREKEDVRDAPRIYTVEREPSFSPPRLSRKDSFEMEQMAEAARASSLDRFEEEEAALKRAYEEARRRAEAGDSSDIIAASYADQDLSRGRRLPKDPILEEADDFYRKSEAARRSASEEMRSRSTSPDHSVVGKWEDHDEDESGICIVAPPGTEHHEPSSPFDKPNADVRIDAVFDHPQQFTHFLKRRARSASEGQLLGTRDPSAERERPLLNVVRPTPVPSPSVDRRREREKTRAARARSRSRSQTRSREVEEDKREANPVKVSPANVVIGPRGEIVDLAEEQPSEEKEDAAPPATVRSLEEFEKPNKQSRKVWGVVNTVLAGKFGRSASEDEPGADERAADKSSRAVEAPETGLVDEEPVTRPRAFDGASREPLLERDVLADRDADIPPLADSSAEFEPSSIKHSEMPGSFGDDLEFAATLGAGLKAAGFDDNIAVNDPQYRQRDSPPGSNDELGGSSRDAPSAVEAQPAEDEWGASMKGKKKKKKKTAKKGKQEAPVESDPEPMPAPEEERSAEPIEIVEPPKVARRFNSPERTGDVPVESAVPPEATAPPEDDPWAPPKKLSKKERKALAKKQAVEAKVQEEERPLAAPIDEVAVTKGIDEHSTPLEEGSRGLPGTSSQESSRDLTTEEPREPVSVLEEDLSLRKLSKKERKALAKKKAAEAQFQDEYPAPAAPTDEAVEATERAVPLVQDGPRELPIDEPGEPAAMPGEDRSLAEGDALPTKDAAPPEDDFPSPKQLTKKEQRKLAKKRAAEAQLQEYKSASTAPKNAVADDEVVEKPAYPLEEGSRELATEEAGELAARSKEDAALEEGSRELVTEELGEPVAAPMDDVPAPDNDTLLPKKLTKKEQRKLAKKQKAVQLDEEPAAEPAREDSADATEPELAPAPGKPEDAWEIGESPPADTVTSPTADDDIWHEAVEEAPQSEEEPPRETPVVQEEDSFAVLSKKKKKKKGSASLDAVVDRSVEEEPKDDQPTEEQPKDEQLPEEHAKESEPAQPLQEQDIWATPTKKAKKGKKNRRKFDDWTDPEPPDKSVDGHTNGHANGHHQTKSDDIGHDPFLANAGTPGEGAGLPGAAAAVVAASAALTRSHATDSPSEKSEKPSDDDRTLGPDSEGDRGLGEGSGAVDPDIVPRQVKYVIDPQHGDLLTLPPSTPASPSGSVDENLPQLPDSRPDTPPEEAYKRELLKSRRRKSTQDSPHARSTSETSIPLPLLLGQRSNPSSPRFARPSPTGSPVSSATDTKKSFSRPISWDGKKDIRPLILPTRRGNESPGRSVSPKKDPQQRDLGSSPTIGLGLREAKEHVDQASDVTGIPEPAGPGESAEQSIDFSTPTKKKKGKGRATADDLARPDSDESASVLDDSQTQNRAPSWEDAFEVPESPKGESVDVDDATPAPVDPVESVEPVSKKDKRKKKKKKKQSLDTSTEEREKPAKPILEEPSAAAEPDKSIDIVPTPGKATVPAPAVEVERSLEPEPSTMEDEPAMTKAEKKEAKKKKAAPAWDEPRPAMEPDMPADEPSALVPSKPSAEPSAETPERSADSPVDTSAEAEEQPIVAPRGPFEAELTPTKSRPGKKTTSQPSWDDASATEPRQPMEEKATEKPTDPRIESVSEPATEPIAAEFSTETGANVHAPEHSERSVTEPATTKAEKKKAKKKKKQASQSSWDDASTTGPEKSADEKAMEEQSTETLAELEKPTDQKPVDDLPIETAPGASFETIASPVAVTPASEELRRSMTESSPDEPTPTSKGKKNKKKKKASQFLWEDVPAPASEPSEQPIDQKPIETPAEPAAGVPKDPPTNQPSQEEEIAITPKDTVIDSKDEPDAAETSQPEQMPHQYQPSALISGPTDAKGSEPAESSSGEVLQEEEVSLPISGKKGKKKKKKKGSTWDEPEATTPAASGEQGPPSVEISEVPKVPAPEDAPTSTDPKGEDKESEFLGSGEFAIVPVELETELKDSAADKAAPEELHPISDEQDVEEKWTDASKELNVKDTETTTPPAATEETSSDPSPAPTSADDEWGQQLGKKKKKKGRKGAKEAPESDEPVLPTEEMATPKAHGGDNALETNDQVERVLPATREGDDATLEKADQPEIAIPETSASDGASPEKDGQAEAPAEDLWTVPVGKKGKKSKKGKKDKKRGSIEEPTTPEVSSAADKPGESEPIEDLAKEATVEPVSKSPKPLAESPSTAPQETVLSSPKYDEGEGAPIEQSEAVAEESARQTTEQSAPDTTTGAEESSSTILESALSGKKNKKKKKKSVSFADLPAEPTADSTVSPMPEKEDDFADVPVETRTELNRSLDKTWDDPWASTTPRQSETSSEAVPSPDAPVEDSEFSLSPKSKKKKKKKGKALEDVAFNSDADVSAPPTPVEESREFPAAGGVTETDTTPSTTWGDDSSFTPISGKRAKKKGKAKEESSSDAPEFSHTPALVEKPATYAAPGEIANSGDVSVANKSGDGDAAVPADATGPDIPIGAELEEPTTKEPQSTTDEPGSEDTPKTRDTAPTSRELEAQSPAEPASTMDVEPTNDGSFTPSKKDKKKKKKKGIATPKPEPTPTPAPVEPEPEPASAGADVSLAPATESVSLPHESRMGPEGTEAARQGKAEDTPSTLVADPEQLTRPELSPAEAEAQSKTPDSLSSSTSKKGKKKKGEASIGIEAEPEASVQSTLTDATPVDPLASESDTIAPTTHGPEPEPIFDTTPAVPETAEASQATTEQSEAGDEWSLPTSTKKGKKKKKKKGKTAAEQLAIPEPEPVAEPTPTDLEPTQPEVTPSSPEIDVEKTADPSLERETVATSIESASEWTMDPASTPEAGQQDDLTSPMPAKETGKKEDTAVPEVGASLQQDKSIGSEPTDVGTVVRSETTAQPEDDWSIPPSNKKGKKKKGRKRSQAAAEPDASVELTTIPELEQPAEPDPTVHEQLRIDSQPPLEVDFQAEDSPETKLLAEDSLPVGAPLPSERGPVDDPHVPEEVWSASLSKKDKKKDKKGKAVDEPEQDPKSMEQIEAPAPAETEEAGPEPESVEQAQTPSTAAEMEELSSTPEEPPIPAAQEAVEGQSQDDSWTSIPMSKKDKKKKKKAKTALQLEPSTDPEHDTTSAPIAAEEDKPVTEIISAPVASGAVASLETPDAQEAQDDNKAIPESPMETENTVLKPIESSTPSEIPVPDATLVVGRPSSVETPAPGSTSQEPAQVPEDGSAPRGTTQEPTTPQDEWPQMPLSKKDKKKKKKAKAKAEAEAVDVPEPEAPPVPAAEETPASVPYLEEPSAPIVTREPKPENLSPADDHDEPLSVSIAKEPVPEPETTMTAPAEEWAPTPTKGKKGKKQKKAKVLEESAQADVEPTPTAALMDDVPKTDSNAALQEPAEPLVPAEAGSIEEPLKPAESVEPTQLAGVSDEAKPVENATVAAEFASKAIVENEFLASKEDKSQEGTGIEESIMLPDAEAEPEPSTAVSEELPKDSALPTPTPEPEDEWALSTKRKGKKKKGKKSVSLNIPRSAIEEQVSEQCAGEDISTQPLEAEGGRGLSPYPGTDEPTQETPDGESTTAGDVTKSQVPIIPVEESAEPELEVTPTPEEQSDDKQKIVSETPVPTGFQEAEQGEWALPSKKGKKGKKKRDKATSEATTPATSRTMSPVLDEPITHSDKPSEDAVPSESSGEIATESVQERPTQALGETDRPSHEPSAGTTMVEGSRVVDVDFTREGQYTNQGLSSVPAETTPVADGSPETPTDERVLELPRDELPVAPDDGADEWGLSVTKKDKRKKGKKRDGSISNVEPAGSEVVVPCLDSTPHDAQEFGASCSEPMQMEAEPAKPDEPEPLVEEWTSIKSKKKSKKAKKGTSATTTPAISRPESPAAEERSTPSEEVTEQRSTTDEPITVSSKAAEGDKADSKPVSREVGPEPATTAEPVEQEPEVDMWSSVGKKKKGKKGKKKDFTSPETTTSLVSRPLSPVMSDPEPPTEGVKEPEPPTKSIQADTQPVDTGATDPAGDDWESSTPAKAKDQAQDGMPLEEVPQPLSPVREESLPQASVNDADDSWGISTKKEKDNNREITGTAAEGAGLGLFRPTSPARDNTLQPFQTGDRTGKLTARTGPRGGSSETRELPAASDDGEVGGAEGQDVPQGETPTISEPLPATHEEAPADLHYTISVESVPTSAEIESADGTRGESDVFREDRDDWDSAGTKKKGRKGKKKGKHVHDVSRDSIHPSAALDENVRFPEESVDADTSVPDKPDPSVPREPELEPAVPEEERHQPSTSVTLEPSTEPGVQPGVQPAGNDPTARKEAVEEPDATLAAQPETEPVVGHETHVPTEDDPDNGFDVSKKKGKKGKKKGKSASATPVASRPLSPVNEDELASSSRPRDVSALDTPADEVEAQVAKEEPATSEQVLDDWTLTPKKKKGKKGKKRDDSSQKPSLGVSRPVSPVMDEPDRDPEPTPDKPVAVQVGDVEPPESLPMEEVDDWGFTPKKKGKKSKKRDQSSSITTPTSRPASPAIDELRKDQETSEEQAVMGLGDLEPLIPAPAEEEIAGWGLTANKKGKKGKKRAPPTFDTTTPAASRAISPTRGATETESPLPAASEVRQVEDDWALLGKKKAKSKGKKAKTDHGAPEGPRDRELSPSQEHPLESTDEPPVILATEPDALEPEGAANLLPEPALKTHLTPAQTTSHITHDAPSGETARPEKKLKTKDMGALMLPEPVMPDQNSVGEAGTIEQPAEGFEAARNTSNIEDPPMEPEEQRQTRAPDKGGGVGIPPTRDDDDTLPETKSGKGKTKAGGGTAAATAGVAALADKFGGQTTRSKKKAKKKKIVDKRTEREDLFDDPLLWESPDKKNLIGEEEVGGDDGFWGGGRGEVGEAGERSLGIAEPMTGVKDTREVVGDKHVVPVEGETGVEDMAMPSAAEEPYTAMARSGLEESTTRGRLDETVPGLVEQRAVLEEGTDVSETKTTGKPIEEELVGEAPRAPEVEDSRDLEGRMEMETEMQEKPTSPAATEKSLPTADVTKHPQGTRGPPKLERTWARPGESPVLGRGEMREGHAMAEEKTSIPPVTPTRGLTSVDDFSRGPTRSSLDDSPHTPLRRSMSRNLEPVPEEEPETFGSPTQAKERRSRKLPTSTSDVNRDSGFATNSPRHSQRSQWQQEGPHRDSGVHLKDWAASSRQVSPEPSSSRTKDPFQTPEKSERRLKRSPRSIKDLREPEQPMSRTPVFREPSPHAPTPEPQKSLRDYKTPDTPRSRYHDVGTPSLSARRSSTPKLAQSAPLARSSSNSPLPRSNADSPVSGQRSASDNVSRPRHTPSPDVAPRRVASNTSLTRHRTPDPKLRPDTPGSIRSLHSATPPLRRAGRRISGDLRSISLSQRGQAEAPPSADSSDEQRSAQNSTPVANEGRVRAKDMTDVYDGFGEGRIGSPRSPTRPHSMRRRQSMQVIELESQVNELLVQNQMLQQERQQYGDQHAHANKAQSLLADRDAEIDALKRSIEQLNREVSRLVEVNEGLNAANAQLSDEQSTRYRDLELLHAEASRELETTRTAQGAHDQRLQEKDAEIADLRDQLETAKAKIQEMQQKILETSRPADADFLDLRDVDYFDRRCQQLCQHVQQWVLRFSKFSDMRACRLTSEINDEKIIDRLDNTILDGSDVDTYLRDRVRRRDIFMSMTMNMVWEFVFTRYLFGMDREQRQKLKSLEKHLTEVGPPNAVRQWRAVTLTLLSRRPSFKRQRELDCEAVVQAVLETLWLILPPPTHLEDQIQSTLRRVMNEAVDLAVMMRTQRAEYMMLPPLEPKYDADGELAETVTFNASLMNERSGDRSQTNEELQVQAATVRVVLFPLVVRRGDESGAGDDEVVVCPAQVLIARSKRKSRGVTPSSDLGGAPVGGSVHDLAPSEYLGTDM